VDRRVDAIAGALHVALAALDLAIVDADFHEAGRGDFGPMHAERDLVVAVGAAGHREGQMVEDAFGKTLVERQPMRRGEIDPRLPFLGAAVVECFRRNPVMHELTPAVLPAPRRGASMAIVEVNVAQSGAAVVEFTAGLPSQFVAPSLLPLWEKVPERSGGG
jgi:hypothetical protein